MIVDVAVPFKVPQTFHYLINPEEAETIETGSIVKVPFRRKSTYAYVMGFPESSDVDPKKLKTIEEVLISQPLFDEPMLKFLLWLSNYYCCSIGEVVASAIPRDAWDRGMSEIEEIQGNTSQLGLAPESSEKVKLTEEQETALSSILESDDKKPTLLFGVTGSGKTEVYMRVLEETLRAGKGAIVLAPEIALTPQLLGRFSARFPGQTAVLHSDLSKKERHLQWQRIYAGQAKVVIGARSAVFAPVRDLGLIVVDEEQEASFKQEDSVRYHARDVAVVRASMSGARVILGSATPSLESFANAKAKKYHLVRLKKRVLDRPLPSATYVDLKDRSQLLSASTPWLTKTLISKIREKLDKKEQVLLYLNRLGFSHFLYCKDCGHTPQCQNCDISLTFYKSPPKLKCHYCGSQSAPPQSCEKCKGFNFVPMGVGTEQLEHSLIQTFPEARIARMDRSVVRTRKALETLLKGIAKRDWDIIIGTQMVAKGHDFPGISLVGILVADASLNLPDFRAHERTFQVITQVSGRAGRAEHPGEVVIQTLNAGHFAIRAGAEDKPDEFYDTELLARESAGYPPFVRLALFRFQHSNRDRVRAFAHQLILALQPRIDASRTLLLGPSEAPISRVKRLYRWQCLVKGRTVSDVRHAVNFAQAFHAKEKSTVQFSVDIDPQTLS